MVLHKLPCDTKYLQCQLSGGADDNGTSTVAGLEAEAVQHLDDGDKESEGLEHSELLGTSRLCVILHTLPDPVFACARVSSVPLSAYQSPLTAPRRSLPARRGGMPLAWISVRVSKPISFMAL